jgi:hypothetical protein
LDLRSNKGEEAGTVSIPRGFVFFNKYYCDVQVNEMYKVCSTYKNMRNYED